MKLSERAAKRLCADARPAHPARVQRGAHLLLLRHSRVDRRLRHSLRAVRFRRAAAGRRSITSRISPRRDRASPSERMRMSDSAAGIAPAAAPRARRRRLRDPRHAERCRSPPTDIRRAIRRSPGRRGDRGRTRQELDLLSRSSGLGEAMRRRWPWSRCREPGPQRTNNDVTFAGEAAILARLPGRRDYQRLSAAGTRQGRATFISW